MDDVRCKIKRGRDCIAQFLPLFVFDLPPAQEGAGGNFNFIEKNLSVLGNICNFAKKLVSCAP